jgi:hypothetical protein
MKKCNRCGKKKSPKEFGFYKSRGIKRQRGTCKACRSIINKEYYASDSLKVKERIQKNRQALKQEVINHYGGKCACCGESETAFLAIDHINGGGNAHRKKINRRTIYQWLKNNGYPEGYQVLCHNCNMASAWGVCPHKRKGV